MSAVTTEGDTMDLNIPIILPPLQLLRQRLEVLGPSSPMDHLLDLLQQPPVDHRCGYNVFQRDR